MQTAFFENVRLAWRAERSDAIDRLRTSRAEVEIAVRGLSESQLTYKPTPDTWSVAEIIEHMLRVEGGIQSLFRRLHEARRARLMRI